MKCKTVANLHVRNGPGTNAKILRTIPVGTEVESDGAAPWASVALADGTKGFCASQYLQPVEAGADGAVHFVVGQQNLADSPNTVAVRKAIHDAFGLGTAGEELNCTEYVAWRVKGKLGIDIKWPVTSHRNGGVWWKIFQDAGLYRALDAPQAGCAMCFTTGISPDPAINAVGHVAFVEKVQPNGSIEISEANWPRNGIYNERTLTPAQWKDKYGARFVEFKG